METGIDLYEVGYAGVEGPSHVVSMGKVLNVDEELHCAHASLVQALFVVLFLRGTSQSLAVAAASARGTWLSQPL